MDEEKNQILDAFVEELQRSLRKLPAKWAGKFKVSLIYDRNQFHGRDDFETQMSANCEKCAYAIEELGFEARQRDVHYQLLDLEHQQRAVESNRRHNEAQNP